jgi:hypothetical protein
LIKGNLPDPLLYVIETCAAVDPKARYKSLAELKQRLVAAYDVLLGRLDSFGATQQALQSVREDIGRYHKFDVLEARRFVERLLESNESERETICLDLRPADFQWLAFKELSDLHERFLSAYDAMVEASRYSWSFAENIAKCAATFFLSDGVDDRSKARVLRSAIKAAHNENRFAAMTTCEQMITATFGESLGFLVAEVVKDYKDTFVGRIAASTCKNGLVRQALKNISTDSASAEPLF